MISGITFSLWDSLIRGGQLFLAPVYRPFLLWILVPIYVNWILSDILSEKTEFSTAASTGFTYLWVGINWVRAFFEKFNIKTINHLFESIVHVNIFEFILSGFLVFYGLVILEFSLGRKEISRYLGNIRLEAFLLIVITPVIYGVVPFDIVTINAILLTGILFFPLTFIIHKVLIKNYD